MGLLQNLMTSVFWDVRHETRDVRHMLHFASRVKIILKS